MAETIKGLNIKLSLDGRDLENELKEIQSDLKEQQKDLKAINANLKYDSSNVELWKQKQSKLNDILQSTKKKLETQNLELEKAKQAVKVGDMSEAEFTKLARNVAYTEAEVSKLNQELQTTRGKITELGNANFEKIGKLGTTLTKSITLPVLGAVSALGALAVKTAMSADEIADSAAKIGLSAESFQEWNHVAKIAGSSTESLNKAFVKVNGILGDIATGNGEKVSESLSQIGLSVEDLKGLNADQAFGTIRDALAGVKDEALRVGIANEFFGEKIGSELLPILSQEASSIADLRNEAQALGVITNEQAAIAGSFNDALDQTKQSLSRLAMDLSATVLPILQSLVEKVRDEIIPTIRNWIDHWTNLESGTKQIILTLGAVAVAIGPVLSIIGKVGPLLNTVSMVMKGVGSSGLFAGAGLNFATLGIGALIAILAVALFQSEDFRALLARLGETLMQLLPPIMTIVDSLMKALSPILDVVIDLVVMLVELLVPIIEVLLVPLMSQIGFVAELLEMVAPLIEIIGKVLQAILVPAIKVLQKVLEPVMAVVEKIVEFLSMIFEWIGDLGSKMGDIAGNFGEMIGTITGNIGDFAANIAKGVGDFVGNAAEKVGGFFGKVGGWFGETFNLKQSQRISNSSNINQSSNHTNHITINTTSPTFDIESINRALGGSVL
jgi:phage-related minor tail protein